MSRPPRKVKHRAASAREVEVKLLLDRETIGILKTLAVIGPALTKARTTMLAAIYYDTPDRRLEKAGLTLRLRSEGKKHILNVRNSRVCLDRPWRMGKTCPEQQACSARYRRLARRFRFGQGHFRLATAFYNDGRARQGLSRINPQASNWRSITA